MDTIGLRMPTPLLRLALVIGAAALLAACATSGSGLPAFGSHSGDHATALEKGVLLQPLHAQGSQPGCEGECARLHVNSLVFPRNEKLTQFTEQKLVHMFSDLNEDLAPLASNLEEVIATYWNHAGKHDYLMLSTELMYATKEITVLKFSIRQYFRGGAHGTSVIQLVNWDNTANRPIPLDELLNDNQLPALTQLQSQAHQDWLETQASALQDKDEHLKMWPFQPTDNVGLTDVGIISQYNEYEIAPYVFGQPSLLIPYIELDNVLKTRYLPNS